MHRIIVGKNEGVAEVTKNFITFAVNCHYQKLPLPSNPKLCRHPVPQHSPSTGWANVEDV